MLVNDGGVSAVKEMLVHAESSDLEDEATILCCVEPLYNFALLRVLARFQPPTVLSRRWGGQQTTRW